ncbi:MAG: phosphate ABC transporter substrate-binding protein [Spirochaetaceae bacterium]|nr:phosphate ABC transporter substrate-binding protein [Spirochaetaceae bacterium]
MKKAVIVLVVAALLACRPSGTTFTIGGSTTLAPILDVATEFIRAGHPEYHIVYEAQGSSAGITGALSGTFLVGGTSRDLNAAELAQGAVPHTFAIDGMIIIVHSSANVSNITSEQLANIYAGNITNWSEIGGANLVIQVVNREDGSGTFGSFNELVMQPYRLNFASNVLVANSSGNVVATVTNTPGAIGYVGHGFYDQTWNQGGVVLDVNGIAPSVANIRNGSYPISRNLYLVTNGPIQPDSFQEFFINWMLSPEGQRVVAMQGFISIN